MNLKKVDISFKFLSQSLCFYLFPEFIDFISNNFKFAQIAIEVDLVDWLFDRSIWRLRLVWSDHYRLKFLDSFEVFCHKLLCSHISRKVANTLRKDSWELGAVGSSCHLLIRLSESYSFQCVNEILRDMIFIKSFIVYVAIPLFEVFLLRISILSSPKILFEVLLDIFKMRILFLANRWSNILTAVLTVDRGLLSQFAVHVLKLIEVECHHRKVI